MVIHGHSHMRDKYYTHFISLTLLLLGISLLLLLTFFLVAAVSQNYNTRVSPEDVILGNDAIMKCSIPSFVSDFVQVQDWKDSEGLLLFPDANYGTNYGTNYPNTIFSRDLEGATKCGTV